MRELGPLTEAEMIAVFLQGELASSRFGPDIAAQLRQDGRSSAIIANPNVHDAAENAYRRTVLDAYRGYDARTGLFDGFPHNVQWMRAVLTRKEFGHVRYINYDYWLDLSGGARRPADAAMRIIEGHEAFGVSNDPAWAIAATLERRDPIPPLIIVGSGEVDDLIVLEGHLRLTAYVLRPEAIPSEIEVIVGTSPAMRQWTES
jgi:hypothetical protein